MPQPPWDARLGRVLVSPLRETRVHPNHITTAGLLVGLGAAALFAGGETTARWGAGVYLLAATLDHADGELARLAGKTSAFGAVYDRIADLVVKLSLFTGMGMGLRHGALGNWAPFLGILGGASVVMIFALRGEMARRQNIEVLGQPSWRGFEIEDILYVIAPVTWCGLLAPFLVAAGIGAPVFTLWVARQFRHSSRAPELHVVRRRVTRT